jgi:hypothetical protein
MSFMVSNMSCPFFFFERENARPPRQVFLDALKGYWTEINLKALCPSMRTDLRCSMTGLELLMPTTLVKDIISHQEYKHKEGKHSSRVQINIFSP